MTGSSLSLSIYRVISGEIVSVSEYNSEPQYHEMIIENAVAVWGAEEFDAIRQGADQNTQYVARIDGEPVIADKPILHVKIDKSEIVADGEDIATLTGLPNPCTIIVDDDDPLTPTSIVEVEGGGFTFSTEDPGPYSFEVRGRFPFLAWKTVVVAS